MNKLRWGLISTAWINHALLIPLHISPRNELTAVASRDLKRAAAYAKQHDIPRYFGSYEEMLADPDIDVVHLATPNYLHHPHAKAALLAGKHVICEKPLAMTSKESNELVRLAEEKQAGQGDTGTYIFAAPA